MTDTSAEMAVTPPMGKRAKFLRGLFTDLAIMTAIGLFLGVLGPFGTIDQPLGVRLVSWLAFAYLGYVCYRPMEPVVAWAQRTLHLPRVGLWIAAAAVSSVPMTIAVLAIGNFRSPLYWPGLDVALTSYFYVFVVGAAVTLLFNVLGMHNAGDPAPELPPELPPEPQPEPQPKTMPEAANAGAPIVPSPEPAQANPLLDALPPALGSDVIALQMEDHYVRVHTSLGSELVLMRLRDAINCMGPQLADIEGRQVHRSWWVARLAVEDVRREGRNVRLVLPGGLEAPVARAQVSELKNAGWL